MNLNYPDYTQGFGGYSAYKPPAQDHSGDYLSGVVGGGASGAATGSAAGPYGALIGAIAGAGLGIYGAYDKSNQEDKNYSAQMAEFERQKRLEAASLENDLKQQALKNQYGAADYVNNEEARRFSQYANYFHRMGL